PAPPGSTARTSAWVDGGTAATPGPVRKMDRSAPIAALAGLAGGAYPRGMTHMRLGTAIGVSIALGCGVAAHGTPHQPDRPQAAAAPVIHWSNEARRAIGPPPADGRLCHQEHD